MTETSLGIKKLLLFCVALLCSATVVTAWVPPIGIPYPPIGIDEVRPADPASWPGSATAGYYYVNNAVSCTDTANTYGYPNNPRCTYPTTLTAGSVVTIAGGTYTGGSQALTWVGTQGSPIWIMGPACSTTQPLSITGMSIRREWVFQPTAAYTILDCLRFDYPGKVRFDQGSTHHVAIRHTEFAGDGLAHGNSSVSNTNGLTASTPVTDIVLWNVHIHDYGDDAPAAAENDYLGFKAVKNTTRNWVLDSHIHNMGGDSLTGGDATTAVADRPTFIYYGRNTLYGNHENCIDIKRVNDIIISENLCHTIATSSSSSGEGIVLHDGTTRPWVMFNTVHDTVIGISSTLSSETYYIGNVLYAITGGGADAGDGSALYARGGGTFTLINNTVDNAVNCAKSTGATTYFVMQNNIFANCTTKSVSLVSGAQTNSDLTYGVLGVGTVRIVWGDGIDRTVSGFQTQFPGEGSGLVEGDPIFVNAATADFHLQSSSSAISAGLTHAAYSTFFSLYGLSIEVDKAGIARPQGPAWDIGAFEFQPPNGGGGNPAYIYAFAGTFEASPVGTTLTPRNMQVPIVVPVACTITAYAISVNPADTATFRVWKKATGTAIPTVSDNINTSGVSISSGTHVRSTILADFTTTSVAAYDMMIVQLSAAGGTATAASLSVECTP